jgi:HD-like signal output (HDOD) protein
MSANEPTSPQRVLFVDDEPRVLRGLLRLLRDERWELHTAQSAADALQMMAGGPYDVIVSDYRMPGMDGVTLLERVREEHPGTVRIVLTGDIDQGPALRSTAVAHQCLTKPCQPELIAAALDRAGRLRVMLARDDLRRLIGRLGSLPSSPSLWNELQQRLSDPDSSAADIAVIISADIAMTTKVLQLVNSSFMGLSRTVSSVAEAVAYLGVEMVRNLVVSVEIFRSFPLSDRLAMFSIDALSRHGQACSQLTLRMVRHHELRDHAAAAALLQDVGQLILASCEPALFSSLLDRSVTEHRSLHDVERDALGFTHADVGAYLLTLWGLPGPVIDAVSTHHHPLLPGSRVDLSVDDAVRAAHLIVHMRRTNARDVTERLPAQNADMELVEALAPSTLDGWTLQAMNDEEQFEGLAGAAS